MGTGLLLRMDGKVYDMKIDIGLRNRKAVLK